MRGTLATATGYRSPPTRAALPVGAPLVGARSLHDEVTQGFLWGD